MAIQDIKKTPGYTPNPVASPEPAQSSVPPVVEGQGGAPSPSAGSGGFVVQVQEDGGEGVGEVSDQTDVDAIQVDSQGIADAVAGLLPGEDENASQPLETEEEVLADIATLQDAIAATDEAGEVVSEEIVSYEGTPIYDASSPDEEVEVERLNTIDLGGSTLQTLAPDAYPKGPIHRRPVPAQRVVEGVPPPENRKPSFINGILGFKQVVDQVHDALPKTPKGELPTPAPLNLPALTPAAPTPASRSAEPLPPNEEALKQGLINRGLPEHVAEGFVINFKDESGLDPGVNEKAPLVKGSRGGYGLYQLTGPRRVRYEAYAKERGVSTDNVDAQLDFLVHEMKTTEKHNARHILNTTTRGEAAAEIVSRFLRPSIEHKISRRQRYLAMG